jgi:prevent-host-death family protein
LKPVARLSATEVARNFSRILNRVSRGEEIEVTRNGATVAVIGPPKTRLVSSERFREIVATAPPVDREFAEDVRRARTELGPPENPWPS